MTQRKVVAVGASAGGVEALQMLTAALPGDLQAALLVVLHVPREAPSALARILDRSGPLPASTAVDGETLWPGRIYVAPADRHLLLLADRIRLSRGPAENGHRPAIDPMFRSVARAAGSHGVAVLLSGTRDDGALGAAAVAGQGGTVLVQDPQEALYGSMPLAAIALVPKARVASATELGRLIGETVADEVPATLPESLARPLDALADYGCPSCGGVLFELPDGPAPHYRCHNGHLWSWESLLAEQANATEGALLMALRSLQDKAALSRRMADGRTAQSYRDRFEQMTADAEQAAALIRGLIARLDEHPL